MEIITKQLKAMLHIETYSPWENPQRRKNYIGKVQRIMFQHHKETQCVKKT